MVLVVAKADTMTLQERRKHLQNVFAMMKELKEICEHPIVFDFEEGEGGFFMEDDAPREAYVDPVECSDRTVVEQVPSVEELFTELEHKDTQEEYVTIPHASHPQCDTNTTALPMYLQAEHAQLHVPLPRIRNVFAVVCDTSESGKREYPWGSLNIYDEEHSDFRRLQRVVLEGEKITELIEQTQRMSLRIYKNAGKEGGLPLSSSTNDGSENVPHTTATVATLPSTPVQHAMAVLFRVKSLLDSVIITLFYAMMPLLLLWLVFHRNNNMSINNTGSVMNTNTSNK